MTHSGLPLFVFGTLMDEDVLKWVSGMDLSELELQPAVANGFKRRQVKGECFPVLVPSAQAKVSGLLIGGLTPLALQRTQFFEGDEYYLEGIVVAGMPDSHSSLLTPGDINAQYFADHQVYDIENRDWSVHTWREQEKRDFMPRLTHYMTFFGSLSAAEADQYW